MSEECIQVFARVRPCVDPQQDFNGVVIDEIDPTSLRFEVSAGVNTTQHLFKFTRVFWKDSKQEETFETIAKPLLNHALSGYNATLFAYGQTGSGKTFTITGDGTPTFAGIVPRAIQYVYEKKGEEGLKNVDISISYLEIYNNTAYDLLTSQTNNQMQKLEDLRRVTIVDNGKKTIFKDLARESAPSLEKAHRLFWMGECARQKAATVNNKYSSRSHTVFTMHFTQSNGDKNTNSQINFVDLAGSEKFRSLENEVDMRKREARYINISLHTLQQVIIGIVEKRPHIPFRDSVLTRFLKDSLVGNVKTSMIATISTHRNHITESISTCRFGESVSEVSLKTSINETELSPKAMIEKLRSEVRFLREELSQAKSGGVVSQSPNTPSNMNRGRIVTESEAVDLQNKIVSFIEDNSDVLDVTGIPQVQFCFQFMKDLIIRGNSSALRVSHLQQRLDESEKNVATLVRLMNTRQKTRMGGDTVVSKEAAYLEFLNSHEKYELSIKLRESLKERCQYAKTLNDSAAQFREKRDELQDLLDSYEDEIQNITESASVCENDEELRPYREKIDFIETEEERIQQELSKVISSFDKSIEDLKSCKEEIVALQRELNKTREIVQRDFQVFWEKTVLGHLDRGQKSQTPKKSKIAQPAYSTLRPVSTSKPH